MYTIYSRRLLRARTLLSSLSVIAFLLCIAGGVAYAQLAGTGAISGTVKDPSGAVVPNAAVTATNVGTNIATTRTTTSAGDYNITPLQPGTYTVSVVAPGFQGYRHENITVNALETVGLNISLTVGQASETVNGDLRAPSA